MKYLVELRLNPGATEDVADALRAWRRHADAGVVFRGARIGTHRNVIFVLSESENEPLVANACRPWEEHGKYQIYPVLDRGSRPLDARREQTDLK